MKKHDEERRRRRIRWGTWHDGRLDCVSGNGIISELGVGDELLEDNIDDVADVNMHDESMLMESQNEGARRKQSVEDEQAVRGLPVVVIRNFAPKGGASKDELLSVLAQWAATLAENQVTIELCGGGFVR